MLSVVLICIMMPKLCIQVKFARDNHFRKMALVMKEYKALDPVRFFGSTAVITFADRLADLIEELGFR